MQETLDTTLLFIWHTKSETSDEMTEINSWLLNMSIFALLWWLTGIQGNSLVFVPQHWEKEERTDRWFKVVWSQNSSHWTGGDNCIWAFSQYGQRLKGQKVDQYEGTSVCHGTIFLFLFSLWFIQVWGGIGGLSQTAARQRPNRGVSIIQIPYLLRVLWHHHNTMSPRQKSIHILRKMPFCKWKRSFTETHRTDTHAHTPQYTHRKTPNTGERATMSSFWICRVSLKVGLSTVLVLIFENIDHFRSK